MLNKDITRNVLETKNVALRLIVDNKDSLINEFSSREKARQEIKFLVKGWKST